MTIQRLHSTFRHLKFRAVAVASQQRVSSSSACHYVSSSKSNDNKKISFCFKHKSRTFLTTQDDKDHRSLWQEELDEMNDEREALFGFTDTEKEAWSNASDHKHTTSFLKEINEARRQAFDEEDSESIKSFLKDDANNELKSETQILTDQIPQFSHVTPDHNSVNMVDVGSKQVTQRIAVAQSKVIFPPNVVLALQMSPQNHGRCDQQELIGPKGPIFATAKVAGIMAAKKTSELIPLCHPLPLDMVNIDIELSENNTVAVIRCECRVTHKTGVEMEALMGASVAALTIYDMVKAISHQVKITDTILIRKEGGKRSVGTNKDV